MILMRKEDTCTRYMVYGERKEKKRKEESIRDLGT